MSDDSGWSTTPAPDDSDELPALHIGDHVADREDDDATLLVVGLPLQRAATYEIDIDGEEPKTLADFNPEYPTTDHAIEAIYPDRTDVFADEKATYAFPRSRLRLVTPIHDRDDTEAE